MKNRKFKTNKSLVIKIVIIAVVAVMLIGSLSALFVSSDVDNSSSGDYNALLQKVNSLQAKVNALSGDCDITTSEVIDAVVVNGEVRLPSEGLTYALNDDNSSYRIVNVGSCTDTNVVVPRTYNGKPVTTIGNNAFEGSGIDSIVLHETVKTIGSEAFKDCVTRFIYIYSTTPLAVGADAFPDTVQGYFVPLHNVNDYKADEGWTAYADKVVAIETPEALNTNIVNVYNALFEYIQNLMNNDASLQQAIENLGGVDAYLLSLITELQGYSQGLAYDVVTVDGVLGFEVVGIGTCTDTDIVIPPTYSGYPVLSIGASAFGSSDLNITSITVPETVRLLKAYALSNNNIQVITFLGSCPNVDRNLYSPDGAILGAAICVLPVSDNLKECRVPSDYIANYYTMCINSTSAENNCNIELADKVMAIETLETLRAELEAVKQQLADLTETATEAETETPTEAASVEGE